MIQLSWRTAQVSGYGILSAAALLGPSLFFASNVQAQSERQSDVSQEAPALSTIQGELLPPDAIGPTIVEGWDEVFAREIRDPASTYDRHRRSGAQGTWGVPSIRRTGTAHSGIHYAANKWGDARMGIGFGATVDVSGAWILGQGDTTVWPASIEVVGYRAGAEVAHSAPFTSFSAEPAWFEMGLANVDRIEIRVDPLGGTTGQYGLDDFTFVKDGRTVVVDFEDKNYEDKLTGTGYAGLIWETGTGDFGGVNVVHAPLSQAPGLEQHDDEQQILGGGGTAPTLLSSFVGPHLGDIGAGYVPPDTCGAVGPNHFVSVVNSNLSVYVKSTGARVMNVNLGTFLAGSSWGDPRVTYDVVSQKFIILATNFNNEISIAISNTNDPTGTWTKSTFNPGTGTDAGKWSDYPTLGCNKDFLVTCAYMVGGTAKMSIFAIDKQNFINTGTLTITAFRSLPWEGAIHAATTYDNTASQYLVSRAAAGLRIRRLNLPASAPTLSELGIAAAGVGSSPPNAPQLGGPGLDTLDGRFMNAVWANGSIWTTNCIASGGKAGVRWYQVDTTSITAVQTGTVDDASLYYFSPGIAANANGDVVLGFTGSNAAQYAACYFTGRLSTDPSGQTGVPVQYKVGEGSYNDGAGPRWGDYALTSLDPTDSSIFWTITEYARAGNSWGTYIAELQHAGGSGCDLHNYCVTSPNSAGPGSIISYSGTGSVAANNFVVYSYGNPVNQNGIFFMGPNENNIPFGNGRLCVSGALVRYPVTPSDGFGVATYNVDNTVPPALGKIVAGSTWKWQYWYRDPMGGGAFFNLSDALSTLFCP
jgi:hypothetical protein